MFDVHVWVLAAVGADSTFPTVTQVPPTTANSSADCLSIAFDADGFAIWSSPHILENTIRVLRKYTDNDALIRSYVELIYDVIATSGGRVVTPPRRAHDSRDHEDNLILDVAIESDALIVVSDDADLTVLNPWNGRLILRPHEFVAHVVQARRHRR